MVYWRLLSPLSKFFRLMLSTNEGDYVWVVELAVRRASREVTGWVFVDQRITELRFEVNPSMLPPGFISGSYLSCAVADSSLALLFDNTSQADIDDLEAAIRYFIGKCMFCVRSITDVTTGEVRKKATAYRYGCATIPITRARNNAR